MIVVGLVAKNSLINDKSLKTKVVFAKPFFIQKTNIYKKFTL